MALHLDPAAKWASEHPACGVLRAYIETATRVRCGKIVVENRTPIFALARRLLQQGIFGNTLLQTYTKTGTPSLRGRIGRLAMLRVTERDRGGFALEDYQSWSGLG